MASQIVVHYSGQDYACFTYRALSSHIVADLRPYHWYKSLVVLGAQYLDFPHVYIASIEMVESMEDPAPARRKEKEMLIERMINYR